MNQINSSNPHIISPPTNFLVFNDNGTCILHKHPLNVNLEQSFKGILQAIYYTASDSNYQLNLISTEEGCLAFRKYERDGLTILLAITLPNAFSDDTKSEGVMLSSLDWIYNLLVVQIGYFDLFHCTSPTEVEKAKKFFEIFTPAINFFIENHGWMSFLIGCEKRVDIGKEESYVIKNYLDKLKQSINQDFVALFFNDSMLWCSSEYLGISVVDRICFSVVSGIYNSGDISECPVYFSATPMENNSNGNIPYKLITVNLSYGVRLLIVTDLCYQSMNLISCISTVFDEFFLSKLNNIKINTALESEIINSICSGMLVINLENRSWKSLLDNSLLNVFETLFTSVGFVKLNGVGGCFSGISSGCGGIGFSDSLSLSGYEDGDEFYLKTDDYVFYYLQLKNLSIYILFPAETQISNINEVKMVLKAQKKLLDEEKKN